MRPPALILALVVALSGALGCAHAKTLTAQDGSAIRPPHNLAGAMNALDRLLDPESIEALRSGEVTPVDLHLGFGMYLRTVWGLWHGSSLARWFMRRGIFHPDDMSSIVLESYVRRLRGEPIELREQIAHYKDYWDRQAADERAEREAGPKRAARIEAERLGWTLVDREVPTLPWFGNHESTEGSIHVAKLEPYAGGVLVFGRHVYGEAPQLWPKWHTGVYFLADAGAEPERVRRHDCEQIHDALTLGDTTHWLCLNGERFWVVLDERAGAAEISLRSIEIEPSPEFLRLGSHADELLLLGPNAVYRWERERWRSVFARDAPWFSAEASVPRRLGDWLYFFDDDHGLVRVDLGDSSGDPNLEDVCSPLLREYYGRWANRCYTLTPSQSGGLWLTAGHQFYSTSMLLDDGPNKLAVFEGSVDRPVTFDPENGLLQHAELDEAEFRRQIPATAIAEVGDAIYLAGDLGVAVSRRGRVEPIVRFDAAYNGRAMRGSSQSSAGPWSLVVFAGEPPSFAMGVGELAVVRATPDGYELRWPEKQF